MKRVIILALVLLVLGSAGAAEFWVGPGQPYSDIRSPIWSTQNGDVIIVKDGTYTGSDNKNIRPYGRAITIKSENGPENCIIDCESSGKGFIIYDSETSNTVIDGFTIINGSSPNGGGILLGGDESPTIKNCIIINCTSPNNGGGICQEYDSSADVTAQIINCLFINNSSNSSGGAASFFDSSPAFKNCTFINNSADSSGGALLFYMSNAATVSNCIFIGNNNKAINENYNTSVQIQNSLFYNNPNGDFYDYDTSTTYTGAASLNALAQFSNTLSSDPLFVTGPSGPNRIRASF